MNKEQQEFLDEAYKNYCFTCIRETEQQAQTMKEKGSWLSLCLTPYFEDKKSFINKCKVDTEFSENWELKIEERELSLEERVDYKKKRDGIARTFAPYTHQMLDNANIPTKLITITYNDKTIESYE